MNFRRVLVQWPARAFDAWWTVYRLILMIAIMATTTLGVIALVLWLVLGIRWGW